DRLVDSLTDATHDQPGALPLLADLMSDLWERMQERGDGRLKIVDRRDIIQIGAALTRRADDFLKEHEEKADAVRRLFTLKLAIAQEEGAAVRRRARRSDCSLEEWALVETLSGLTTPPGEKPWRLVVTGEEDGQPTAEVAHEVLLREWTTLQNWLQAEK